MAAAACFRATFTRDGHKQRKNRKWLDGYVTQSGRDARLHDESGSVMALGRLAADEVLEEGAELEKGFGQGIIVHVDVPCTPPEMNGASASDTQPAAELAQTAVKAPAAAPAAARSRFVGAGLRGSGGSKKPAGFRAPRPAAVGATAPMSDPQSGPFPTAADQAGAAPLHQHMQHPRRQQFTAPARKPAPPAATVVQQAPALCARFGSAVRSDDDILRLLTGAAGCAPVEAAAPAAKRQRVQHAPASEAASAAVFDANPRALEPARKAALRPVAARPKWDSYLQDNEDEGGGFEGRLEANGAGGAAQLAALQSPQVPSPAEHQQQCHQYASAPTVPAARQPGGAQQRSAWGRGASRPAGAAAPRADLSSDGLEELELSPTNSWVSAAGWKPIVRPPQAAELSMQPARPMQQQEGWQAQRAPLQPNRQPPAAPPLASQPRHQQVKCHAGPSRAAGGSGAWKQPAVTAPGTAGAAVNKQQVKPTAARAAPAPGRGWNKIVDGVVQLGWPTAEESARPARKVAVPDRFASGQQYVQTLCNALWEELNLRVAEVAQAFHTAIARTGQQPPQPQRAAQNASGAKQGGAGYGSMGSTGGGLEARLRQARVPFYGTCELFVWRNLPKKGGWNGGGGKQGKRGRGAEEDEEAQDDEEPAKKTDSIYLILRSGRQKAAEYRRDNLWIISTTPEFQAGFTPGQPGDRSREPWVAVARSLWHGPNQDGKFEIEFLSPQPPRLGRSQLVYAIKGPDASIELGMIDLLRSGAAGTLPLLPHLLRLSPNSGCPNSAGAAGSRAGQQPPQQRASGVPGCTARSEGQHKQQPPKEESAEPGSPCYSCSDDDDELTAAAAAADGLVESPLVQAEQIAQRFGLNVEQAEVLNYVAGWAHGAGAAGAAPPPICLVHGPFGSGKSTLLVALLQFLLQQRGRHGSPLSGARVLVSAHTNVAVDRVLTGLLESGCTDFLRVGPLRRVSRRLLAQSLHASESKVTATAAAELREMLKEAATPAEAAAIRTELAAAEKGADRQRRRLLKTVPVVGVTCCSSVLAALDGQRFDVVVLDECSQMVEPLSAVPLLRAQAKFLIAAGDPLQLPPVIASPVHVTAAPGQLMPAAAAQPHGLLRPLFVRLTAQGLPPFLLRRQYRCHPDISAVPNRHFYGGQLLDGCSREQRASLLPTLPNLAFLDVRGQEQYGAGRSASNQMEAEAVVAAVERLVAAGVGLCQCGVICFFKAQVALVRYLLDRRLPQLEQRQRQRRQGAALSGSSGGGGSSSCEAEGLDALGPGGPGQGQEKGEALVADGQEEEAAHEGQEREEQGIRVATVDSFQGAECDVIILTTTVTRPGAFASDACRLNVALTRAKRNLIIVGCAPALQKAAPAFAALLAQCRSTPGGYHPSGRLQRSFSGDALTAGGHAIRGHTPPVRQAAAAAAAGTAEGLQEEGLDEEGWAALDSLT